jgi:CDP-diacylglycerol---glycerol-3-phosphate 3-phosphatidyltransferase
VPRGPLNVPNLLTIGRILVVPVLVVAVLWAPGEASMLAASIFVAAALTDIVDGHLARTRNLVTDLGKLLDPLADKLLVGAALLSLVAVGRVAAWAVGIILAREVVVSVLRSAAAREGIAVAARPLGKLKMGFQTALIIALLCVPDVAHDAVEALLYTTLAITVLSGADMAAAVARARGSSGRLALASRR